MCQAIARERECEQGDQRKDGWCHYDVTSVCSFDGVMETRIVDSYGHSSLEWNLCFRVISLQQILQAEIVIVSTFAKMVFPDSALVSAFVKILFHILTK